MKISKEERMGIHKMKCIIDEISDDKTVSKMVAAMLRNAEKIITLNFEREHDFDDPVYSWLDKFKDGKDLIARTGKDAVYDEGKLDYSIAVNGKEVYGLISRENVKGTYVSVSSMDEEAVNKIVRVIKQFVSKLKSE